METVNAVLRSLSVWASLGRKLENSYRRVGCGKWIQITLVLRRDTVSHEKVRPGWASVYWKGPSCSKWLRKYNTSVCFKQSLMALCAQPWLGVPDRPCVHCQIQHSQPCTTAYIQACREMLTRLRVQIHGDIVFAGYGHVLYGHCIWLYLQDTELLLLTTGKERVSTVHGRNKGGQEKGEKGEREMERDSFQRFLKACFM